MEISNWSLKKENSNRKVIRKLANRVADLADLPS